MSSKHVTALSLLMKKIQESGLNEVSKKSPAYDIATDIINNPDPQEEDHEMARILSDPTRWGLGMDLSWKLFCGLGGES